MVTCGPSNLISGPDDGRLLWGVCAIFIGLKGKQ